MTDLALTRKLESHFNEIRQNCLKDNILYEDPDFPADESSICLSASGKLAQREFEWLRPKEICERNALGPPSFFVQGSSRFDLNQGDLGNCWVVAAAACLAESRGLLERVVPSNQVFDDDWYAGVFRFYFWRFGKWTEVLVDDRLPTENGVLVFVNSKHQPNEFWGALLEKAYAKQFGSYESLTSGNSEDALTDFTGGLVESYFLHTRSPAIEHLFYQAFARQALLCATIFPRDKLSGDQILPNGLVAGHAYSITAMQKVPTETKKATLLRIRNPWGTKIEWQGPWSDRSKEWNNLSLNIQQKLARRKKADGEFWIDLDDFVKHFDKLEICNLTADCLLDPPKTWEVSVIHSRWEKGRNAGGTNVITRWRNPRFRVAVADRDEDQDNLASFVIELTQKDNRFIGSKQLKKDLFMIGFYLYKVKDEKRMPSNEDFFLHNHLVGRTETFVKKRIVFKRFLLPPDHYIVIPSTWFPNQEGDFMIRIFSESIHVANPVTYDANDLKLTSSKFLQSDFESDTSAVLRKYFESSLEKEIDAIELKKCLEYALSNEGYGLWQLKYVTCKHLVIFMDADESGKIGYQEFLLMWSNFRKWVETFMTQDEDKDGVINALHLRAVLAKLGFVLDNKIVNRLRYRYADSANRLQLNDYIQCVTRVYTAFYRFKVGGSEDEEMVKVNPNELLLCCCI